MDVLHDRRTDCLSIQITTSVGRYLDLAGSAHERRGGIAGQRDVLKTTTSKRIRERMVGDIRNGAILPPVVIGVVVDPSFFSEVERREVRDEDEFLKIIEKVELTIIDGMQRTAALQEASAIDVAVRQGGFRVEFWLAKAVRPLVYRMLVLNTGQVPWTLARQLSVVYAPLLEEIRHNVKDIDRIIPPEKSGKRVSGGQYTSDSIVEMYLAFSLRKTAVDTRETLSEEFSRLDFVDNLSDENFQEAFYESLSVLASLDKAFDRHSSGGQERFSRGRDVFGGHPARIGFMVAIAQNVLGRPGLDREPLERKERMDRIVASAAALVEKLLGMSERELEEFLCLDVLTEILDKRVGQVGRYERSVFFEAFKVLIDERFDVPSMKPCWRAS